MKKLLSIKLIINLYYSIKLLNLILNFIDYRFDLSKSLKDPLQLLLSILSFNDITYEEYQAFILWLLKTSESLSKEKYEFFVICLQSIQLLDYNFLNELTIKQRRDNNEKIDEVNSK